MRGRIPPVGPDPLQSVFDAAESLVMTDRPAHERPTRPDVWSRARDTWHRGEGRKYACPACEYSFRGLPAPGGYYRCPECGTETPRHRAVVRRTTTRRTWRDRWPLIVPAIVFAAAVLLVLLPDSIRVFALLLLAIGLLGGVSIGGWPPPARRPGQRD